MPRDGQWVHSSPMETRTAARVVVAAALSLGAVTLAGMGLAAVYGFSVEYGGGAFADLAFLVVPIPVLAAVVAVVAWPGTAARTRVAVVLGTAAVMGVGGLAADALGQAENRDRLVAGSEHFTCNGPNSEVTLPAAIDRTWRELPREAPIYGPIEGSRTDCVAAVSGDGARTFADYTDRFRALAGWRVEVDRPRRFVMSRDDVRVTDVRTPDDITTIRVGVTG